MAALPDTSPFLFIRRFVRGEYSLAVSYCTVGLIVYLTIGVLLAGVSFLMHRQAFNPYEVVGALIAIWSAIIIGQLFQSIGVWRSASRHRRVAIAAGRVGLWGMVAQAVIILSGIGIGYAFVKQGMPQLVESWRMAFEGDPDIPAYAIRIMRDGTEAEITGGFKYGLSHDAAKIFATAPNLRIVHLNSGGGRLGEAIELAKLIRARGLATYTSASCASACTIAFVAGRERYLKSGARIGFHRAIFAGVERTNEMRGLLRAANVEYTFIERAMAQPAYSIWYPTEQELRAANVVVTSVDPYRYAASGLGAKPTLADFKSALRRGPLFAALEATDRQGFEDSAELYQRRYFEGMPDGRIADEIRLKKIGPVVRMKLVTAPDELLIDYARLMADQFAALDERDADACFDFATRSGSNAAALLPAELRQREEELSIRVLEARTSREPPTAAELNAATLSLSQAMIDRYGAEKVRLLIDPARVLPAEHALFCALSAAMFRTIADLPPAEAGTEMSSIFSAMAKTTSGK
ncbi:hypothetical protein SAMN02745126_05950 [Enhydrobacter aerosaccus]|uniref:Clp protease n=1 Tax=Enhydrobacter aerosaccus TaxID=225324 RepID=A0A1T4TC57_9HYPH|nr:hypothetical protein [Enhydrobacter aerosaccus]SKA37748.1 hypothetical protein SAMN02745126_05950 [Enhydrobacter aerosaccus]